MLKKNRPYCSIIHDTVLFVKSLFLLPLLYFAPIFRIADLILLRQSWNRSAFGGIIRSQKGAEPGG